MICLFELRGDDGSLFFQYYFRIQLPGEALQRCVGAPVGPGVPVLARRLMAGRASLHPDIARLALGGGAGPTIGEGLSVVIVDSLVEQPKPLSNGRMGAGRFTDLVN